jgi:ATP/maltotriose-dependent transcriptional regulator MalT
MTDAIEHAITAGDVHYAADELEQHWLEFYSAGQPMTLIAWIDRLPGEVVDAHPALALARAGVARAVGRLDEVEYWLERAEQGAADAPARGMASSVAGGVAVATFDVPTCARRRDRRGDVGAPSGRARAGQGIA